MQTPPFLSPLLKRLVNGDILSMHVVICINSTLRIQNSAMFASVIAPKYFFMCCVVSERKYQTHDMIIVESGSKIVVLDC